MRPKAPKAGSAKAMVRAKGVPSEFSANKWMRSNPLSST